MKCLQCEFDNPATATFCKGCGAKLDLSATEIKAALIEKQKGEQKKATEYWLRQSLFLSSVAFVAAMTFFVVTRDAPKDSYYVPAASKKADYIRIQPGFDPSKLVHRPLFPLPSE